jgi:hypothetical protein
MYCVRICDLVLSDELLGVVIHFSIVLTGRRLSAHNFQVTDLWLLVNECSFKLGLVQVSVLAKLFFEQGKIKTTTCELLDQVLDNRGYLLVAFKWNILLEVLEGDIHTVELVVVDVLVPEAVVYLLGNFEGDDS